MNLSNNKLWKSKYLKYKTKYFDLKYQQDIKQIAGSSLKNDTAIIFARKNKQIYKEQATNELYSIGKKDNIEEILKQTNSVINGLIIYKNEPTKIHIIGPINKKITSFESNISTKEEFTNLFEGLKYHSINMLQQKGKSKIITDICNKYFLNNIKTDIPNVDIIGVELNNETFSNNKIIFIIRYADIINITAYDYKTSKFEAFKYILAKITEEELKKGILKIEKEHVYIKKNWESDDDAVDSKERELNILIKTFQDNNIKQMKQKIINFEKTLELQIKEAELFEKNNEIIV